MKASSPPDPLARSTGDGLLARAESHAISAGERVLTAYLKRLLDEQGAGAVAAVSTTILPALQSLVAALPRLLREGASAETLELARTLGERAHQAGLPLASVIAEGLRLHEQLMREISADLRAADRDLALGLLHISRSIMQLGQTALLAFEERALADLVRLAESDSLTGLANRRVFDARLDDELNRARRFDNSLAVILIDVDGLKSINDTLGHAAGDHLLRTMAAVLQEHTRSIDLVARIGGDEFALLLPESDLAGARALVERLRDGTAGRTIGERRLLFSAGVAVYPGHGDSADALMRYADQEMYRAKRGL